MREKNGVMAQRRELTKDMAICGLFASLIAVGAFLKIVIPVGVDTMNFTLQWLFVLLAGLLLGSKRAFYSVTTYLVIGLVGFPVFARGGGPAYLIRPTFGFLLGFAFAAYAMGKVCEILHSSKIRTWILAAAIGYVIYYGTGILFLLYYAFYRRYTEHRRLGGDFRSLLSAYHVSGWPAVHSCHYACRKAASGGVADAVIEMNKRG